MNDYPHARRRTARRFVLIVVVCASLALVATACGVSGKHSSARNQSQKKGKNQASALTVVQESYRTTTSRAKTARVVLTVASWAPTTPATAGGSTGKSSGPTMEFGMVSDGVIDFANDRSAVDMRFLTIPQLGTIEVRSVGSTVYEKFPRKMRSHIPSGGKPWLKIDQNALYKKRYGVGLSQMQSGAPNDKVNQLNYLEGVGGPVEKAGQEKVRGVPTTHYRANIDLNKLAAQQSQKEMKRAYGKLKSQIGASRIPAEVWIDRQGRVRRFKMTFPTPNASNSAGGSTSAGAPSRQAGRMILTEDYYDFGVPVNVKRPPADQTVDFTRLADKMGASQG